MTNKNECEQTPLTHYEEQVLEMINKISDDLLAIRIMIYDRPDAFPSICSKEDHISIAKVEEIIDGYVKEFGGKHGGRAIRRIMGEELKKQIRNRKGV